jgi:hypothetical protein
VRKLPDADLDEASRIRAEKTHRLALTGRTLGRRLHARTHPPIKSARKKLLTGPILSATWPMAICREMGGLIISKRLPVFIRSMAGESRQATHTTETASDVHDYQRHRDFE